jgi:uncharacterized membrane protein YhaH (DUF805 family)
MMSKPPFEDLLNYREGRRNRKSLAILLCVQTLVSLLLFLVIVLFVPLLSEFHRGIAGLFVLAVSIPMIMMQFSAFAQRCRDMNVTGWMVLLLFVPIVSMIFQAVLLVKRGTRGENRYGPDPLAGSDVTLEKLEA